MTDDLSEKMRNYLAELYRLADMSEAEDAYVGTSALADLLFVTAPAVNRMVNRLKELGFLEHEPYQGIRLTPAGTAEALKHLRAHRLAECFLLKVMGIAWEEVYQEANQISAALSPVILERMATMAGNPLYCPHGEPIPTATGQIEAMEDVWLAKAPIETPLRITRFRTRDMGRLNYIKALGLMPNEKLEVLHIAPFNGPMQLKIHGEYRIIGHNLAELIRVKSSV